MFISCNTQPLNSIGLHTMSEVLGVGIVIPKSGFLSVFTHKGPIKVTRSNGAFNFKQPHCNKVYDNCTPSLFQELELKIERQEELIETLKFTSHNEDSILTGIFAAHVRVSLNTYSMSNLS